MSVLPVGFGSAINGGYQIERSLRFNSADTTYLTRTPASAGNRQKFTISFWMKRTTLGTTDVFTGNAANGLFVTFRSDNTMYFYDFGAASGGWQIWSARVFRDVGAWYHIVIAVDSTQATDTNRAKIYINGVQETLSAWTVGAGASRYPSLNANFDWNNTNSHEIGYDSNYGYFNGYLTEFYNIDGQQLEPSSFGETDSNTGVWKPKSYTGTYGTNGFFLKFADNSNTTAATLGKDSSGNGNNWTPNNFSVTAGAGNDSLVDSPTNYGTDTGVGGSVRGNYCTMNPINATSAAGTSLSNGNLQINGYGTGGINAWIGTLGVSSGKWYYEVTMGELNGLVGISKTGNPNTYPGGDSTSYSYTSGVKYNNGASTAYGAALTGGDVVGVAYDLDAGTITFYKNGASQGQAFSGLSGNYFPAIRSGTTGAVVSVNFGQRAFAYTAPSGFKALCTQNLPTPTISNGASYMAATLYTGNGTTTNLVNTVNGASFQPDLVWQKNRSSAANNILVDSVRGGSLYLISNTTGADASAPGYMTFNSNGVSFTSSDIATNQNAQTYVAWQWNAGGSTVTNTSGTISSQVRANTTSGFSIVTYTGNGSAGATVGHGLGVTPDMIIVKSRSVGTGDWVVWHSSLTSSNNNYLILNSTAAVNTANQPWNNTLPTSSVFSLRTWDSVNQNGSTYVAYCFDAVAGYSAFGSYTGNGSTDGPFVYTGFRPKYLLLKLTNTTGSWQVKDSARNTYNVTNLTLYPNLSNAEASDIQVDFLSNGFKLRSSTGENANGNIVIYAAFAENPFKYILGA